MSFLTMGKLKKLAKTLYYQGFDYLDPRIMNVSQFNLGIPGEVFGIDAGRRTWVLAFVENGGWGYAVVEITNSMQMTHKIEPVRFIAPASSDISATIMRVVEEHKD